MPESDGTNPATRMLAKTQIETLGAAIYAGIVQMSRSSEAESCKNSKFAFGEIPHVELGKLNAK